MFCITVIPPFGRRTSPVWFTTFSELEKDDFVKAMKGQGYTIKVYDSRPSK
jgi:hypothetical protein